LGCGSRGRILPAPGPAFNPQYWGEIKNCHGKEGFNIVSVTLKLKDIEECGQVMDK
jgi:hypothetical protein